MSTNQSEHLDAVQEAITHIRQLERMRCLQLDDFAPEGKLADRVAQASIKADLQSTQLYKIFHELKNIQKEVWRAPDEPFERTKVLRLIPLLAYAAGRKVIPEKFYQLLKALLDTSKIETNADFLRAFDFIEAILAYHKYHSEKKKRGGRR